MYISYSARQRHQVIRYTNKEGTQSILGLKSRKSQKCWETRIARGRQLKFATFNFFLRALTYLLIWLSFSLFSLFLAFWTFLFSYFLPHPLSISTPFSYLLPSLENGVTSNIDILLAPLSYRPQISICHPFPPFIFIPIPIFLSFLLVRKFSYCFLFHLFLTYFFLILSPAYFFLIVYISPRHPPWLLSAKAYGLCRRRGSMPSYGE